MTGGRPTRWLRAETGGAWLDLVATVVYPYGPAPEDRLATPELLGEWLETQGLRPVAAPGEADLSRAKGLRDALNHVALASLHGKEFADKDTRQINETLAADRPVTLRASGGLATAPPETTTRALARLARQAVEDLTGPRGATLGQCADHDCRMLFLDPTGRRRWCSAEICGVRNRVREHRRRNA